jgi:UDP-N-acetylmuramyl pentapeptide phosphotransferase/UDP-N-acetylglucosamine-1-phosphate transferase
MPGPFTIACVVAAAALLCAGLIHLLWPVLRLYAMARPNARSSHATPTPQGGGIAVVTATLVVAAAALYAAGSAFDLRATALLAAATVLIAATGAVDDVVTLGVAPRIALQGIAVALMLWALPDQLRVVPVLPWWIERALMLLAGLWFVNLANFMDGIDWMTVAEVLPIAACVALLGYLGAMPPEPAVAALTLAGAILGFAPFNKPVARLFLGDVGSLPVGLLLAWMLVTLAGSGHLAAALLLPLYYGADATITLARRIVRREPFWEAHRSHFYQRAVDGGASVQGTVQRVFAVNVALAALALATVLIPGRAIGPIGLACGVVLVGALLRSFARHGRQ